MEDKSKLITDYESVRLDTWTDQDILNIAHGRFVTKPTDFNLRKGKRSSDGYLKPFPGGLYDGLIFGSIYENKCNCGSITEPGTPCPECGTMPLNNIERFTRYGLIDLGVYYTSSIKVKPLLGLITKNFRIRLDITDPLLSEKVDLSNEYRIITLLYFCQFNYDKDTNSLILTDSLDDISKVSLEGLIKVIKEYKPELESELMKYINRYIPVLPSILRKVKFCVINNKKSLKLPKSTAYYRSIIIAADICNSVAKESKDLYQIASHYANLRLYASKVLYRMSGFLKSSKESFIRSTLYKINSAHSGRAVIIEDPNLPIDTIKIPKVLAYEMYKKQFLRYMMDVEGVDKRDLSKLYNDPSDKTWEMFDRFIKNKAVIINRAPTLHAQNIQCYKLQVSNDYTIHFPLLTTAAQNADFDGDAVMFYAIPDELKDYMLERCSPANYTTYPNNDVPILKPRHEILYGLTIATKILPLSDPDPKYASIPEMIDAFKDDKIWVYDRVQLGDTITSYGRVKIANILGIDDLDDIIGSDPINAKNIVEIFKIINNKSPEERVKILDKLQEFALSVVTLEGATSIELKDIYYDIPEEYRNKITEILESDLDEKDKIREAEEVHAKMVSDILNSDNKNGLSKKTISRINEGNRGKISAIVDMLVPSFNIDAKGKLSFSEHALIEGLTEAEYLAHSAANRELLITKANMVPFSGYLNRQLKEAGQKIILIKGESDPTNKGILIPRKYAEGRTTTDGEVLGKSTSDEMVRVRSIITTELPYVTEDMFSKNRKFTYDKDGKCYIGMDWMTSYTTDITQSGLSLKHGGTLRYVREEDQLIAPYDTEVEFTEDLIILKATGDTYIKPTRWSTKGDGFYKKGSIIGEVPNYRTISYVVESLVKIFKAQGNLNYKDMMNNIKFSDCFNHSTAHTLRYSNNKVHLGKRSWKRDSRLIKVPIGSVINPYQRICSGTQSMESMNKSSLDTRFNIFFNQISELHSATEEILEMVFCLLTNHGKDWTGVMKLNTSENNSAFSALGYGYAKKAASRIVTKDLKINAADILSQLVMGNMFYRINASINKELQ